MTVPFSLVLAALNRANRLRTAVSIVTAWTLLEMYLQQVAEGKRRPEGAVN